MATLKQKKAAAITLENGGVVSSAMLEAGYSPAMAKNPQKLTESKGWQELLKDYLPDKTLIEVHQEGLLATKIVTSPTEPDSEVPDFPTRHKYLETAYKLKRYLGPEAQVNNQFNADAMKVEFGGGE